MKVVGQNSIVICGLAIVLYIHSLRSHYPMATKESSSLMASLATTGQFWPTELYNDSGASPVHSLLLCYTMFL